MSDGTAAIPPTSPAVPPPAPARRPRWLRRGPLENAATAVILAGVAMLLQPFSMALFTWSFVTTLAGTLLFVAVTKLPE